MRLRHFYFLNLSGLLAGLVLIPAGLLFQFIKSAQLTAEYPEANCSFIGILYIVLIFGFIYALLFLLWNSLLGSKAKSGFRSWIQFVIIFLLGVLPVLFLSYWGWVAE